MRGRVIYHLQRGVEEGLEEKARERKGRGCEVKSPSLSPFSVLSLSTSWRLTTQRTPLQPCFRLFSLTDCSPLPQGPRKLLFRSLVQQIHTDAQEREDAGRERISKHMLPRGTTADLETICFFVNKRHAEKLM